MAHSEHAAASEVVAATVAPGEEKAHAGLRVALNDKASEFPGFLGVDVVAPTSPAAGANTWIAVLTFESEDALQRWRGSRERAELVGRIGEVAVDQDWVLPVGFAPKSSGNATAAQSPTWKQAMAVLAVLYALVAVLDITLGNFIGQGLSVEGTRVVSGLGLPFPFVVFVGNAVGTVVLTWVLMPVVTRLLGWWLTPSATRAQTIGGVVLMLLIYAIELLFFGWVFKSFGF